MTTRLPSGSARWTTLLAGVAAAVVINLAPSPAEGDTRSDVAAVPAWTVSNDAPPQRLRDTGLYEDGAALVVRRGIVGFSPQYPLWSDGAAKRRWLWLPPGTAIDASRPDAWEFPRGTRLWKQFSHGSRPIETRLIERRPDGSWLFATYVWNDDGSDAVLAPAAGLRSLPAPTAPGGRYAVPALADCLACHEGAAVPVLGATALQLSGDRDPLAANREAAQADAADLRRLVEIGWLRHLPPSMLTNPPRIAAKSPVERAALGYLHGNCSHCHNRSGSPAPVALTLAQSAADPAASHRDVLGSTVAAPSRYRLPGLPADAPVIAPGRSESSVLAARIATRHPQQRMPPLGSELPDPEGLTLVFGWIAELTHRQETRP